MELCVSFSTRFCFYFLSLYLSWFPFSVHIVPQACYLRPINIPTSNPPFPPGNGFLSWFVRLLNSLLQSFYYDFYSLPLPSFFSSVLPRQRACSVRRRCPPTGDVCLHRFNVTTAIISPFPAWCSSHYFCRTIHFTTFLITPLQSSVFPGLYCLTLSFSFIPNSRHPLGFWPRSWLLFLYPNFVSFRF